MSDNRPSAYFEGDVLVIRASALGTACLTELVAPAQGIPPGPVPDWLQRAFDAGNEWEPKVVERMEAGGWRFLGHQEEAELRLGPKLLLRYHPDGIGICPETGFPQIPKRFRGVPLVVEVKALADSGWRKAARRSVGEYVDEYPWQLSTMMHETGYPGVWVAVNKSTEKILYEFKETPPVPLSKIHERATKIQEMARGSSVFSWDPQCLDSSTFPCRYFDFQQNDGDDCDFADLLEKAAKKGEEMKKNQKDQKDGPAPPEDELELNKVLREYVFHRGQADEAKQRYESAKDRILAYYEGEKGKQQTEEYELTVVESKGRETIAWEEVPSYLKDQLDKYKKVGKPSRHIRGVKRLDV